MWIMITVLSFLIGLIAGSVLANLKWINNALRPQRIICFGRFYKVVDIDDFGSWYYLGIHKENRNEFK